MDVTAVCFVIAIGAQSGWVPESIVVEPWPPVESTWGSGEPSGTAGPGASMALRYESALMPVDPWGQATWAASMLSHPGGDPAGELFGELPKRIIAPGRKRLGDIAAPAEIVDPWALPRATSVVGTPARTRELWLN